MLPEKETVTILEFAGNKNNSTRTGQVNKKGCRTASKKTGYRIKEKALSATRIMAIKVLCNKTDEFYDSLSIN